MAIRLGLPGALRPSCLGTCSRSPVTPSPRDWWPLRLTDQDWSSFYRLFSESRIDYYTGTASHGHTLAVGQEHDLASRSRVLHQLVGTNDFLKRQAFGDDGLDVPFGEQPEQQGEILSEPLGVLSLESINGIEGGFLTVM
jgi:hypothetical protein